LQQTVKDYVVIANANIVACALKKYVKKNCVFNSLEVKNIVIFNAKFLLLIPLKKVSKTLIILAKSLKYLVEMLSYQAFGAIRIVRSYRNFF